MKDVIMKHTNLRNIRQMYHLSRICSVLYYFYSIINRLSASPSPLPSYIHSQDDFQHADTSSEQSPHFIFPSSISCSFECNREMFGRGGSKVGTRRLNIVFLQIVIRRDACYSSSILVNTTKITASKV